MPFFIETILLEEISVRIGLIVTFTVQTLESYKNMVLLVWFLVGAD